MVTRTEGGQLELETITQLITTLGSMLEDRTRSFDDEKIRIEEFNRNLNNIQNKANELLKPLNSKQKLSPSNPRKSKQKIQVISKAKEFLSRLKEINPKFYKGIGVGTNLRGGSAEVLLGGLFWNDKLVHLTSISSN